MFIKEITNVFPTFVKREIRHMPVYTHRAPLIVQARFDADLNCYEVVVDEETTLMVPVNMFMELYAEL